MNKYQVGMSPSRLHGVREWVIVFYRKLPHIMNVRILNRAMRDRQIAGDFDSVEGLADRIGASRSTVSRFFSGKNTSLAIALRILEALKLTFDQMFIEISPALLAKLQAEGMVYDHNGVTVVTAEILTWPEATEIREHFRLPALTAGPAQQALPHGGEASDRRLSHDPPVRDGGARRWS
jgi:transcriptional regulator with XRE-family HTH domain